MFFFPKINKPYFKIVDNDVFHYDNKFIYKNNIPIVKSIVMSVELGGRFFKNGIYKHLYNEVFTQCYGDLISTENYIIDRTKNIVYDSKLNFLYMLDKDIIISTEIEKDIILLYDSNKSKVLDLRSGKSNMYKRMRTYDYYKKNRFTENTYLVPQTYVSKFTLSIRGDRYYKRKFVRKKVFSRLDKLRNEKLNILF